MTNMIDDDLWTYDLNCDASSVPWEALEHYYGMKNPENHAVLTSLMSSRGYISILTPYFAFMSSSAPLFVSLPCVCWSTLLSLARQCCFPSCFVPLPLLLFHLLLALTLCYYRQVVSASSAYGVATFRRVGSVLSLTDSFTRMSLFKMKFPTVSLSICLICMCGYLEHSRSKASIY